MHGRRESGQCGLRKVKETKMERKSLSHLILSHMEVTDFL
jgi:hypothetical protein